MLVFTEPQKVIGTDFPGQSKPFRAHTNPFASHALTLIIVVTHTEVFLEVFPRIRQVVLRLCRNHTTDNTRTERACCASDTPSRFGFMMN
jgi:hypothetical protein